MLVLVVIGTLAIVKHADSDTKPGDDGVALQQPNPVYTIDSVITNGTAINLAVVSLAYKYGLDENSFQMFSEAIVSLASCESTFNTKAYNPKDTDGLPAYGLLQYKWTTFYTYAKKYGIDNPNIWDPNQQLELTLLMLRDGLKHQWGCAKGAVFKKLK